MHELENPEVEFHFPAASYSLVKSTGCETEPHDSRACTPDAILTHSMTLSQSFESHESIQD